MLRVRINAFSLLDRKLQNLVPVHRTPPDEFQVGTQIHCFCISKACRQARRVFDPR
ncbi:MAG: hypothetical protein V3V71_08510 [Roseateles sp.]|jgi:hypothetical protein|nr:hypothetical protein [Burkholderiaceae bacterium]